ncbi:MAG: TetR/AcrR family transcriptional regulator [Paludibaculum sp.]
MARKKDRRVERTQHLLQAALLALIKEKEFDAISVQEIIDRANVGRATFYAHYDNKEDLLESGFEDLRLKLKERQSEARARAGSPEDQLFAFSHHLLDHADENREILPAMVSQRGGALIQHLLRHLLVRVVREDVNTMLPKGGAVPKEAIVQFIAGGLYGLMMWWLGGKRRLSVDELDRLFRTLAIPAVKAAAP